MGRLNLPDSGHIYLDSNCLIYSVEKIKPYAEVLQPAWESAETGKVRITTSQLSLLETLVRPLREKDSLLEDTYRSLLLQSASVELLGISLRILEGSARLRAELNLKTPDAIHAATALASSAGVFITNDAQFRRIRGLRVLVLSEVIASPDSQGP